MCRRCCIVNCLVMAAVDDLVIHVHSNGMTWLIILWIRQQIATVYDNLIVCQWYESFIMSCCKYCSAETINNDAVCRHKISSTTNPTTLLVAVPILVQTGIWHHQKPIACFNLLLPCHEGDTFQEHGKRHPTCKPATSILSLHPQNRMNRLQMNCGNR